MLGQGPTLLLPLTGPQTLMGVLVLDLAHRPRGGEVALALTLAQRAMAAISGTQRAGNPGYAGQRPPRAPRAQAHPTPSSSELTPREREVVRLLASGLRNKEIAVALGISERTVKFHLGRIFDKLDVDSRTELLLRILAEEPPKRQHGLGVTPSCLGKRKAPRVRQSLSRRMLVKESS